LGAWRAAGEWGGGEERSAAVKSAVAEVYGRMQEAGDAPLGPEKERFVDAVAVAVTGMLATWKKNTEPLEKALWTVVRPMNAETVVEAGGREVRVTGTLSVGEDGTQAMARCASAKSRVRMEMWVKHLLGVASGVASRTCLAQIGSPSQCDDWGGEGMDAAAAKRELGKWVRAYGEWRGRAAPFEPESSAKFAETGDAESARDTWRKNADVYQTREFGSRGPVGRESFGELAELMRLPKPALGHGAGSRGRKG
jgi:exonuclease V gamma subunit